MGARYVKRFDAAHFAEEMFGHAGVEAIGCEKLRAPNQSESCLGNDQMKIAAFAADRTVAIVGDDFGGCFDLEFDAAAMTPTEMLNQRQLPKRAFVYAASSIFFV
jgi:hypothetical protein